MYALFSPESKLYRLVSLLASSVVLNLLWFASSLPVVTMGAATTALHQVCLKLVREEETHLVRDFFRAFRENFKQGTLIGLLLLVLGGALAVDGYVFHQMRYENVVWTLGYAVFFVVLAAYAIVVLWVFPLMAKFRNTALAMVRNALMIGMRFLLCTVCMAAVHFAMAILIVRIFTPAIVFGYGTCALVCAWLCSNILRQCEEKSQEVSDEATVEEV